MSSYNYSECCWYWNYKSHPEMVSFYTFTLHQYGRRLTGPAVQDRLVSALPLYVGYATNFYKFCFVSTPPYLSGKITFAPTNPRTTRANSGRINLVTEPTCRLEAYKSFFSRIVQDCGTDWVPAWSVVCHLESLKPYSVDRWLLIHRYKFP